MSYADSTFYIDDYGGSTIPTASLELLEDQLKQATRAIDSATMHRIQDFDQLTPFQQMQVGLATCAQADYNYKYGSLSSMLGLMGSYSIGDVSMSGKSEASRSAESQHYRLCEEAIDFLRPTNLLARGV